LTDNGFGDRKNPGNPEGINLEGYSFKKFFMKRVDEKIE
jgi:hypothetical protein